MALGVCGVERRPEACDDDVCDDAAVATRFVDDGRRSGMLAVDAPARRLFLVTLIAAAAGGFIAFV